MSVQADLIKVKEEIAGKRARIQIMFKEADKASDGERQTLAKSIKSANDELAGLADRADKLQLAFEMEQSEREALKSLRMPVGRQIEPENPDGSYSSTELEPGTVRAFKSADKFGEAFGSTHVTLDTYLKAALTGNWSNVPDSLKSLSVGSDLLGGYTVPEPLANRVIDLSRAASRVIEAGALTVPMQSSTLRFARLLTDPTAAWKVENDLITASDATFEPVELTARTLAARVIMSVELADDSPTIGNTIERALSAALAGELDRAALLGSGTPPEPQGLIGTDGVTSLDVTAGFPDVRYDDFSRAVQLIRMANGEPNVVIYGPDVAGELERLRTDDGDIIEAPQSFKDLRKLTTSRLAGTAAIGQWNEFVIGMRQELRIEASRQANDEDGKGFSSYSVLVRATLRADFAVLKPSHFVILTDIAAGGS